MGLRDIGATLPPGFRFYPSDEELVCHYLYKKIANEVVLKGTLGSKRRPSAMLAVRTNLKQQTKLNTFVFV
ncbi:hypothetical protein Gogos_016842 [Gossypium gossypioides]|uniref:NAC domain-containing protein n=1 Tax=Gossypium gossypioides TaxID=34282 RepID=A0A7J9B8Y3_GOSGO|nr:hypothetical protein [Gossypium gossypioides]